MLWLRGLSRRRCPDRRELFSHPGEVFARGHRVAIRRRSDYCDRFASRSCQGRRLICPRRQDSIRPRMPPPEDSQSQCWHLPDRQYSLAERQALVPELDRPQARRRVYCATQDSGFPELRCSFPIRDFLQHARPRMPLAELALKLATPFATLRRRSLMLAKPSRRRYALRSRISCWYPIARQLRLKPVLMLRRPLAQGHDSRAQSRWKMSQKTARPPSYRPRIRGTKLATPKREIRAATMRAERALYAALETDGLAGALAAIGKVTVHTVPCPSCDSIEIFPPFNSIARIANGRPSPLPLLLVV